MKRNIGKAPGSEEAGEQDIDLTPMLDVVFIMLIFFIVTATFIKEAGIEVDRPRAVTAKSKDASMLVAIGPNNDIWIDQNQTDPRAVRADIERLVADNPKGSLVIQADSQSNHETLVQVMEAARLAGVQSVAISTTD